jgi:antitoxin component of MazEF toxin-antitoxin module
VGRTAEEEQEKFKEIPCLLLNLCYYIDMANLEDHYRTRLQGIRRQGGTVQVYANIPLPLASALDLEAGETVTWKVVDRTLLLLVRLPERKPLTGVSRPVGRKPTRRGRESRS